MNVVKLAPFREPEDVKVTIQDGLRIVTLTNSDNAKHKAANTLVL